MVPSSPQHDGEPDQHLAALVSSYLDRRQAGEDLTPERFAAEHPEVSEELRLSLKGLPLIDQARALAQRVVAGEAPGAVGEIPAIGGYDVVEEIGRGGMGVVYRALQVSTKRMVALKLMRSGPFASGLARKRFQREVELAARLRHPNIVTVLEGGHVNERPYYAMEYVPGIQLQRYLSATEPDLRTTLRMFERICTAVDYAHRQGVIHCDLKPANVLVDESGDPHILDFGLAKATGQTEGEEALTPSVPLPGLGAGTLFYLSPEQAACWPHEVDVRTDVHALGVMLFEALTGKLPYDTTGSPWQVAKRILETPPTPPSSLSGRVTAEVETIILKALEKDKNHRYHSAKELGDDIRRYLEGEPIRARLPNSLYVLRKKLGKHRLAVALGAAAVALSLIGLLAGVWWKDYRGARDLAQARREVQRAQLRLESQDPGHQLGHAQGLFERHPELPEAALLWAQACYRTGQHYIGMAFLEDMLERNPSRWACRALLAEFCRAAGDEQRASLLHVRAEREAPDTAEAWYLRSFATLKLRRALQCVQEAVQRQPSHVLAWERLTRLRLDTGDLNGALAGAEKLIALGEEARHWTLFRGVVFARQGRSREAIKEYARVGPSAYVYLAHAYRRVKEYEKAVEYYTKAMGPAPQKRGVVWHYYQRATPLWILGRRQEALEDYDRFRLLHAQPWHSDARAFLILHELDRQPEAQEVLNAALRDVEDDWLRRILRCLAGDTPPPELVADGLARNNPEQLCEAYYYAAEVCLLAGDHDQARKWFEQCVQTGVEFDPDASAETPMNEFELAQWRLDSLFADRTDNSRP